MSASSTQIAARKIDEYREVIDGWLRAIDTFDAAHGIELDLSAPRKRRQTAKRIFDRLCAEHQAQVSYSRVRA